MIRAVRIDDALWDGASRLRRDDWRVSISDLVDDARIGEEDDHLLHLACDPNALHLTMFDAAGAPRGTFEVAANDLKPQVDEYLLIIKRMQSGDDGDASSKMAALDMAKKLVHDAGAKTLARTLPNLARDHETYRRLFSLLLAILVDVTTLGALSHRGHVKASS